MDIAIVIHELIAEGGGERQCLCLARALSQRGHQVTVYTCEYIPAKCFPKICKELTIEEMGRGSFLQLRRPLFARGYLDMMHLANSVKRKHQIWNPHHWPGHWAAVWLKRRLGGRVVWMCNDVPDLFPKSRHLRSLKGIIFAPLYRAYYWYDRKQSSEVDVTLLLSLWAEQEFKKIYPLTTQVVRSGAYPESFVLRGDRGKIRSRFGYAEDEFVLLWLGIFMPHRRLEDAIEAVKRVTATGVKVRLLLAGSNRAHPDYFKYLQGLTGSLESPNQVTFAGKVDDQEIPDFYAACDAFVFPNDQQTWGLVVLEAMACGCPVLVSRGAGIHEILTDGLNALLFAPRYPDDLAAKIKILCEQPGQRKELATNGMDLVRSTYTFDRFAAQVEGVCGNLIGQKSVEERSPSAAGAEILGTQ